MGGYCIPGVLKLRKRGSLSKFPVDYLEAVPSNRAPFVKLIELTALTDVVTNIHVTSPFDHFNSNDSS